MIDKYLNYIQEGYVLSDKTIAVNLDNFESGKKNKLLIIGVTGSGKTTLGEKLAKKYKVKWINIDTFWWRLKQKYSLDKDDPKLAKKVIQEVIKYLRSNERMIMEGINILEIYNDKMDMRRLIMSQSIIMLGLSSIRAGIRAGIRNKNREGGEGWRELYWMSKYNIKTVQPVLNIMRKDVMKIPGVKIEEYKIPG